MSAVIHTDSPFERLSRSRSLADIARELVAETEGSERHTELTAELDAEMRDRLTSGVLASFIHGQRVAVEPWEVM